jgi:predicted SnoaL-like aldol condensation-catalyzing enzyme
MPCTLRLINWTPTWNSRSRIWRLSEGCAVCSLFSAASIAFDTLFNKRDYKAADGYWSSNYIQHSAHIAPGRDGLFNLVRSTPPTLKYEPGLIVAENDYVIVHGRFSGTGRPISWIAADVVRVADGMLAEHWVVLQDEATKAESQSGLPMFGTTFRE